MPVGVGAWLYLVVLWLTLTPMSERLPQVLWAPPQAWVPLIGNVMLFAPLGFVQAVHSSARLGSRGGLETWFVVRRVAMTAAILSGAVELAQYAVPGRHPSVWDLALNTGGAALAAWCGVRLVRSGLDTPRLVGSAMALVFSGVLLFQTATGFAARRMLALAAWNEDYPILASDELSGARAYDGDVSDARICAVSRMREACAAPGATRPERMALAETALTGQAVKLSAVVESRSAQTRDARIVTFSMDHLHRNATLYQEEQDLIFRLRTPLGGPNGTGLEFVLPEAVPDRVPVRVIGSFETGRIELSASGERAVRAAFPIGPFSGWWLVRRLPDSRVEPDALLTATLVSAAAFSLPLGLVAVLFLSWGPAPVRALVAGLASPVSIFLLASVLRIHVSVLEAAAAFGFGVLGGTLGLLQSAANGGITGRGHGAKEDGSAALAPGDPRP